ncbi:MAG: PAS domain-containing sensor histidine kinase [Thermosediminibacteraceae bacterium]|nr:PAS domain-containing sensor histidine kinase [Thermosediminibacteraceae bacterium]
MNQKMIEELCRKYSDLSQEEIKIIQRLSEVIQIVADLTQADIFIDCITRDPDAAIVVAEAKPRTAKSLYRFSVVGQLALRQNEPAVIRTLHTGFPTIGMRGISQEGVPIKQSVVPITSRSGRAIGTLIMEQDITEQVSQEMRVKELIETTEHLSETLFKLAFAEGRVSDILPDGLLIIDKNGKVTYYNNAARELFYRIGFLGEELRGKRIIDVISELEIRDDFLAEQMYMESKINGLNIAITSVPLNSPDGTSGALMFIRDITEIREKEKELMRRSVVIKEIHHRIKNNLQTVASLLRIQARRIKSRKAKKAFSDSISRILSIAVVHDILSKEEMEYVDIDNMIRKIVEIVSLMIDPQKNIQINIDCSPVKLPPREATSLALIINELIHNAIEHAFVGRNEGEVSIILKEFEESKSICLIVKDNGVGLKKDFSIEKSKNLGLNIIKTLVEEDLKGYINIHNDNGVIVEVLFPLRQ